MNVCRQFRNVSELRSKIPILKFYIYGYHDKAYNMTMHK